MDVFATFGPLVVLDLDLELIWLDAVLDLI
jgi:hypothetical protein